MKTLKTTVIIILLASMLTIVSAESNYRFKVVLKYLSWTAARQYCVDNFGGDLIQHDPRLYTQQGRQEIAESLNLPKYRFYTTGIQRDENKIWRRISDNVEVQLDGWYTKYPRSNADWDVLKWNAHKNTIVNQAGRWWDPFICEY